MTNPFNPSPSEPISLSSPLRPSHSHSHSPLSTFIRHPSTLTIALLSLFTLHSSLFSSELAVTHTFDDAPIQTSHWHRNATGERLTFTRLSYFLSELEFVATDGSSYRPPNSIHYIDAFAPESQHTSLDLPANTYTSLRFKVGLAPELNHSDPNQYPPSHPLSILENAMHWSWQAGYIFCAIEGYVTPNGGDSQIGFSYHIANDSNVIPVEIQIQIKPTTSQQLILTLDLTQVLSGTDFALHEQTSTHSRPDDPIALSIAQHLASAFSIQITNTYSSEPSPVPRQNPAPANAASSTPYPFSLPRNFPIPDLPTDYPLTAERVALGDTLFHSTQLSRNGSLSCASCHQEENAFSDPRKFSVGFDGTLGRRQAMPLLNLAWKNAFFWDGRAASLREQALHPIQDPTEMGADLEQALARLQNTPTIAAQFEAAFGDRKITAKRLGIALENFLLTLTSYHSKFDSAIAGNAALTQQEKRGFELFMTEYDPRRGQYGADCFHCHGNALFSDNLFHNNGLLPTDDRGLAAFTNLETDAHKFATPSLRNVAATAPYMHDGRFKTLAEVIEHYNSGIQNSNTLDPNLAKHPTTGLQLSEADKAALVAFLETLTDPRYKSSDQ